MTCDKYIKVQWFKGTVHRVDYRLKWSSKQVTDWFKGNSKWFTEFIHHWCQSKVHKVTFVHKSYAALIIFGYINNVSPKLKHALYHFFSFPNFFS